MVRCGRTDRVRCGRTDRVRRGRLDRGRRTLMNWTPAYGEVPVLGKIFRKFLAESDGRANLSNMASDTREAHTHALTGDSISFENCYD